MKKILSAILLTAWVCPAFAVSITDVITGADMVGMKVRAKYSNGHTETLKWTMISNDPAIPYGEGYKGGVASDKFSLSQQGYTLGNLGPNNELLGLWSLANNYDYDLLTLSINAIAGGVVFDTLSRVEGTPGSNVGRSFLHDGTVAVVGDYRRPYRPGRRSGNREANRPPKRSPDLWGRLTLYFTDFGKGDSLQFMADTDRVRPIARVPEIDGAGAYIAISLVVAFGAMRRERRKSTQLLQNS